MMRMRLGMPLRSSEMMKLESAVTTVTEAPITKAGFSWAVTARHEQMPNTNTVTGFALRKGSMRSFLWFMRIILLHRVVNHLFNAIGGLGGTRDGIELHGEVISVSRDLFSFELALEFLCGDFAA